MQDENIIAKDGGYASRKLAFAVFTSLLIVVAAMFLAAPILGEVISGLVAVAGVYITGNVITKWRSAGIEQAKLQIPKPETKQAPQKDDLSD